MSFIYNMSDLWNAGATTFTAIKMNVTDTASASGSLLLDLQVGGASQFSVSKSGSVAVANQLTTQGSIFVALAAGSFSIASDLILTRSAAASLRLGNADAAAPVAQTLGVQSVVAGTTNTSGTNFTIKGSAGTGTGAGGSLIFQVAPAGSSGSAQNAFATALTIGSNQNAVFAGSISCTGLNANGNVGVLNNANFLYLGSGVDVLLYRDAANTLALRNGAAGQTFNVYDSYADASNYRRASLSTGGGAGAILSLNGAGSGNNGSLYLRASVTAGTIEFGTASTDRWRMDASGHFLAIADNTYDIGATSVNRPRSIYTSSGVVFANSLAVNSSTFNAVLWNGGQFGWTSGATVSTSSATDTGLKRSAAAIIGVTNGSTGGGSLEMQEVTAPAAPATNGVRIYAEDNGGGKTRLMALFATGAAQQIAIEP
jgi:hypothetical protein